MGTTKPFTYNLSSFSKKLLPWTLYVLLPLVIIHYYLRPLHSLSSPFHRLHSNTHVINRHIPFASHSASSLPPSKENANSNASNSCDFSNGKWVHDEKGPLYNGTTCGTIKDGQNCVKNGRPDNDYIYWRWKPKHCNLPRFDPQNFLQLFKNKQLAFVGDSIARNQLESLLCMLSSASTPLLLYSNGEDNKFRKWHFPSHNFNISIYWSPFLVKGVEKSDYGPRNYNTLHLESVDEMWGGDINRFDTIVLSVGHWFLHRAVFYYGDSKLGCHYLSDKNCTEIGFYDVYAKAYKTALSAAIERRVRNHNRPLDIIVTTFSPAHFEGEWDKFGACPKTKPYSPGKKKLEGMDAEMRNYEIEEVEEARRKATRFGSDVKIEVVDVTKLSLLRPDGHPGPYMNPFPFANGISERVQNDCVHWCMPGAIDTWNEILLEILRKRI